MSTELYGPQSLGEGGATPGPGPGADPPVPPVDAGGRLDDLLLRLEVWRDRPALIWALGAVAAIVVGLGWWSARPPSAVPIEDLIPRAGSAPVTQGDGSAPPVGADQKVGPATVTTGSIPSTSGPAGPVVVHVVGQVARPGLVVVPPGSRIDDAVAAAGGVTPSADVERLNLAAPLGDGSQVRVPAIGEDITGPLVVPAPGLGPGVVTGSASDGGAVPERSGPVNLNTAGGAELETLPGIGPATAAAIIAWRTEHGGFLTVEDLTRVPGIGPVKLAALGDLVTV